MAEREPVHVWGQREPADHLPPLELIEAQQEVARAVQLGEGFRWPEELESLEGSDDGEGNR